VYIYKTKKKLGGFSNEKRDMDKRFSSKPHNVIYWSKYRPGYHRVDHNKDTYSIAITTNQAADNLDVFFIEHRTGENNRDLIISFR